MKDMKKNIIELNAKDLKKVSGGAAKEHMVGGPGSIWRPHCAKCGKEMPGGIGVKRVDGTIYEHPYFCEVCAATLDDKEKNVNLNL